MHMTISIIIKAGILLFNLSKIMDIGIVSNKLPNNIYNAINNSMFVYLSYLVLEHMKAGNDLMQKVGNLMLIYIIWAL
ncbi:MAG UNVERIFIED_CONTAM: hypothetical protein LVQ98_01855 [Rickettsiaceae bacterium]